MNKKLEAFIRAEKVKEEERLKRAAKYEMDHQKTMYIAKNTMFPSLRKASREDYIKWLEGFVNADNVPTHYYDYPFDHQEDLFYMAIRNFELTPLYGAKSINIIVPEGIKILGGHHGHSNVFCYDGYKHYGSVPVFSDTIF